MRSRRDFDHAVALIVLVTIVLGGFGLSAKRHLAEGPDAGANATVNGTAAVLL